jgi:hypothetical protein
MNMSDSVPDFDTIMEQKSDIMSLKNMQKRIVYAVMSYRYVNINASNVLVAKLWAPEITWSEDNTQEIWCCKLLKECITEKGYKLPFWMGVEGLKRTITGSKYYPIRCMDFNEAQMERFPWAKECRKKHAEMGSDNESVYSATTQLVE